MSEIMMRHLLGSDEKLEHDPGAEGPSDGVFIPEVQLFLENGINFRIYVSETDVCFRSESP